MSRPTRTAFTNAGKLLFWWSWCFCCFCGSAPADRSLRRELSTGVKTGALYDACVFPCASMLHPYFTGMGRLLPRRSDMGGREILAEDLDHENNGASGARQMTFALEGARKRPQRTQRANRPSPGRSKRLPARLFRYSRRYLARLRTSKGFNVLASMAVCPN